MTDVNRLPALVDLADRLLPGAGRPKVQPATGGGSTPVYQARRGGVTLYIRLAEQTGLSLDPERAVHERLVALGATVPEVVFFANHYAELGRSVLVTTEIPGGPIAAAASAELLRSAGRDLALINSIAVGAFGWVRRDLPDGAPLTGEHDRLAEFALEPFSRQLAAITGLFAPVEVDSLQHEVGRCATLLDEPVGVLAHGDFDWSHIYQEHGDYRGIIDFGEIRGAGRFYDLGHFALHERGRGPEAFAELLAGYAEVASLPDDARVRIALWSVLIGVGRLAIVQHRPPAVEYRRQLIAGVRSAMAELRNA